MFRGQRRRQFAPEGFARMRANRFILPLLMSGLVLLNGCSFNETIERPDYAENTLYSLCGYSQPFTVSNHGIYDSRSGRGDILLAGQLSNQPVENLLDFRSLRLQYLEDTGLHVTLVSQRGEEQSELIPTTWIRCVDDAMELDLPSDAFYVWASVGVKTRHLRLQVASDSSLIMHNAWEEKGMGALVIPLKFSGDSWASFPPDNSVTYETSPQVTTEIIGECGGLTGNFAVNGTSVRLDGSVGTRSAEAQFFRPEIMGDLAQPDGSPAAYLRISHATEGGIDLTLLRQDGTPVVRRLEAAQVSCEQGRWIVKGEKDVMSPFMLLMGSGGVTWEDLALWRDSGGALMVLGTYRSRGAVFLIPVGNTSELFMRFELVPDTTMHDVHIDNSD